MTNLSEQTRITTVELRDEEPRLRQDERQPCEVWTRVMGYHRPVASFNTGKKGEHAERRFFAESRQPA
ncbi:MAG: hypothetical protein KBF24_05020 [Thiobacillaceae bacterium]|jgi:hypothetical protein|nr:hypothetical protein [Hydrogenophilales bacterium]MBP8901672.1 hypothetical protein [Thiobacillaceae bacterium]MBP9915552.1 hypothetical protein [Thiobacillaceae bacterium]